MNENCSAVNENSWENLHGITSMEVLCFNVVYPFRACCHSTCSLRFHNKFTQYEERMKSLEWKMQPFTVSPISLYLDVFFQIKQYVINWFERGKWGFVLCHKACKKYISKIKLLHITYFTISNYITRKWISLLTTIVCNFNCDWVCI